MRDLWQVVIAVIGLIGLINYVLGGKQANRRAQGQAAPRPRPRPRPESPQEEIDRFLEQVLGPGRRAAGQPQRPEPPEAVVLSPAIHSQRRPAVQQRRTQAKSATPPSTSPPAKLVKSPRLTRPSGPAAPSPAAKRDDFNSRIEQQIQDAGDSTTRAGQQLGTATRIRKGDAATFAQLAAKSLKTPEGIRQAVLLAEILAKPKALRR